MRALIFSFLILAFALPAHAKKTRKPSNKGPKKIYTFVCKDDSEEDTLIGIANLSVDMRDPNVGIAATTIFVKKQKDFQSANFTGRLSSVPGGFVIIGKPSFFPDIIKLNIHPNEQTTLPGLPLQNCSITGQMESN